MGDVSKILIRTTKSIVVRNIDSIIYLKAEGSYSSVYFAKGESLLVSKNLSQIHLPEANFFRIHSSVIINISHIKRVEDNWVFLSDESRFPIAKRRKKSFLLALSDSFLNL
ncbi:hypothetical protein GWK08_03895 [Leptobacterium flavescens]|uniref:HTH LytTR-type domain-containing protein n=1 Tax=Leptobacterium flavescens TaxID=472055 RepID=A0A6P0UGZ0_9FLAO|nr:LytTR family DNA-binding domain-containing protein [Leptobacterium flavescens]NER12571.1 hypothetical protein [Leptobacterium flavescens]